MKEISESYITIIDGNIASIEISGTVTDAIADIVGEGGEVGAADITEVIVTFDPGGDPFSPGPIITQLKYSKPPGLAYSEALIQVEDDFSVSFPVTVVRDGGETTSEFRPNAFKGTFSTTVQIPLRQGRNPFLAKAFNFVGNQGFD